MLKFKALSLSDREILLPYLNAYKFNTYEYSFLTLYLWRDYCNVEYAILEDALIIKKTEDKKGSYFMQPMGYSDVTLPKIVAELQQMKKKDSTMISLFRDIEEPFLLRLQTMYESNVIYAEDRKNFDYIYETQKLIDLTGEKLHNRKNQYKQFIKKYNYSLKDIQDPSVVEDCLNLAKSWFEGTKVKHKECVFELAGIRDIFNHLDFLSACGMVVYVDGKIAGFTIGEKVSSQMAIIHVEKGNTNYKGIYAFINKTFAQEYLYDMALINREEDLGLAELRKAKLAYDPLRLEKKYIVNIL